MNDLTNDFETPYQRTLKKAFNVFFEHFQAPDDILGQFSLLTEMTQQKILEKELWRSPYADCLCDLYEGRNNDGKFPHLLIECKRMSPSYLQVKQMYVNNWNNARARRRTPDKRGLVLVYIEPEDGRFVISPETMFTVVKGRRYRPQKLRNFIMDDRAKIFEYPSMKNYSCHEVSKLVSPAIVERQVTEVIGETPRLPVARYYGSNENESPRSALKRNYYCGDSICTSQDDSPIKRRMLHSTPDVLPFELGENVETIMSKIDALDSVFSPQFDRLESGTDVIFTIPASSWLRSVCKKFKAQFSVSTYRVWSKLQDTDLSTGEFPSLQEIKRFDDCYKLLSYLMTGFIENSKEVKKQVNKYFFDKHSTLGIVEGTDCSQMSMSEIGKVLFSSDMGPFHFAAFSKMTNCSIFEFDYELSSLFSVVCEEDGAPTIVVGRDFTGCFIFCT